MSLYAVTSDIAVVQFNRETISDDTDRNLFAHTSIHYSDISKYILVKNRGIIAVLRNIYNSVPCHSYRFVK